MAQPSQAPQAYTQADTTPLAPPRDPIAALRVALRGHYEFERELGQGAFATVYLARDLKHERRVAIKVLHADPNSETGELRFIREIRMLAQLQHPNILPLHDSGHVETLLYYVMPYVSGETLRDRILRERTLSAAAACNIARDAADALAYAHAQGIIHRDIKPENILLSAGHPILADFGIARAIRIAGVRQLTQTGTGSPGTPAYMSPEQLLGEGEVDGRSDTYSLGCVLFEMLTGKPPFSDEDGFIKRFTDPAPKVTSIRNEVPAWMDDVVSTALARSPSERFQTAQEFAERLGASDHSGSAGFASAGKAIGSGKATSSSFLAGPWAHQHATALIASASIAALVVVGLVAAKSESIRNTWFSPRVDSSRVALLPVIGTAAPAERARVGGMLSGALSEWRGLPVVSEEDVASQVRKKGAPRSAQAAATISRMLGAGKFIWSEASGDHPARVRLQLFDAVASAPSHSISFVASDTNAFRAALVSLLKDPGRPLSADGGDGKTSSYDAWVAYGSAHSALWAGDLTQAESLFRRSISADPAFAPARLWLAQSLAWRPASDRADWRDQLRQALSVPSGLSPHDQSLALALASLNERKYPQACVLYSTLAGRDSTDFAAQYGLGQCLSTDSMVVAAQPSQSGWKFRSRYSDAARAFMRALTINPSAHEFLPFNQLLDVLPIAPTKTRRGRSADGAEFAAYPSLINDTVVFIPYPVAEFAALPAQQTAPARNAAIQANLDALLDFTLDWTRRSPQSAQAYLALADVREARGEIARGRYGDGSAMDAVHRAQAASTSPREVLAARSREAWLTFKLGEFAKARAIADSLLAAHYSADDASTLIGLAALTGKIGKTAELARVTNDYAAAAARLPIQVMDAAAPFFAFTALGACGDTVAALEARLDDQLSRFIADDQLKDIARAVKARPLSMLAPCTEGKSSLKVEARTSRVLRLQQAYARNDRKTLATLLDELGRDAKTQRPGDFSLDFTYQVAWIKTAIGDTAGAIRDLDRSLGALPSFSASSFRDAAAAAAAGRAMVLRAQLANATKDFATQAKWSRAVVDLWLTSDPPLQPVVSNMRRLSSSKP